MGELLKIAREVNIPQGESSESYQEIKETTSSSKVNATWPPETQSIVDWFYKFVPPAKPFYLEPHVHVVDPGKFFALLSVELEAGPTGPRARMGTLQGDLQKLKVYLE